MAPYQSCITLHYIGCEVTVDFIICFIFVGKAACFEFHLKLNFCNTSMKDAQNMILPSLLYSDADE
jgi:hypothetical protein